MKKIILLFFYLNLIQPVLASDDLGEISLDDVGRVYKNHSNEIVQEFWLLGRYHGQNNWYEGSQGQDELYESRRARLGLQGQFFNKLQLHAQAVSGTDFNPTYNGFTELWLQWTFNQEIQVTIGQQKHRFSHDRNASSRYIDYLERGMLTNMFRLDYTPAITLQGKYENSSYYGGIFSNATSRDMIEEFSNFDSGYTLLFANYYDAKSYFSTDSAYLHFSLIHSDSNEKATNLNQFRNGITTAFIITDDSLSLVSEFLAGIGGENGSAIGINIQPGYFLTDKLQIVSRYQMAYSNKHNGLSPQVRHDRDVQINEGDLYQALYGGVNYYIVGHRIKFMLGLEYANMNGEYLWTASSMIRLFFGPHSGGAYPMNALLPGDLFEYD